MRFLKIAKNIVETIAENAKPHSQTTQPSQHSQPQPKVTEEERDWTDEQWRAYFKEILNTEFPLYGIREDVAVTDLVGFANDEFQLYKTRPTQAYKAEWGQPYTFVLEQAGNIKGVIMLGKGHSHDSNVKYLISRMYAKKLGIPYINFYTQMPNERDYVIGRIRKFLN